MLKDDSIDTLPAWQWETVWGPSFKVTKEAMEDDIMGIYEGEGWKKEDGTPCENQLEIMEARLVAARVDAAKADEKMNYLDTVVSEAKTNPAYRALLEVV